MEDFYELLGVGRAATDAEIKAAYRRLARELHPDSGHGDPEAEERFKLVTLAYETLRDPEKRRVYDTYGAEGLRQGARSGGVDFGDVSDIFEAFFGRGFGGGVTRRGPPQGADVEVAARLTFAEAVFGSEPDVTVRAPVACETCRGSGARPGTSPVTCTGCGGSGEVRRVRQSILGQMVTSAPCPTCGGMGEEVTSPCTECAGEGRVVEERVLTVKVPPGVDDGSVLRVPGGGAVGPRGGPPGDLYVHLRVAADERFRREGADLVHVLRVPVSQAALGAVLSVETLDGSQEVELTAGSQTGKVIRLRGLGVPHRRGRGDLLLTVMVETPTDLTPEQADLLRQLAESRGEPVKPPDSSVIGRIRSAFR
ncbi:MAG TPA: molecular chaperone DnaJ [Acidimicrobiales bacterium]|nr:molecular chaperone DnaJ [Acidimicrobiales bacterium]